MGSLLAMTSNTVRKPTMGIRIQPREIEVPDDDPFKNDLLGRKEPAEVLTHLAGNLEGPCVLAVDAAWGTGKTTFIGMWSQHLRNQGFPVVPFNAWETDFSGDPFLTLTSELTEGLHEYPGEPLATKIADTKQKAKEVVQWAVPGAIRLATAAIPVVGSELGQTLASYAEGKLSGYQESQKSIKAFRRVLHDMASELSAQKGHPLIVVIDELDRCRPSYAVELLEVAKHLFSVDHIVFVLAVNRSELAHSIRALYGNDFDAMGYLRRFFDVDFRLPDPERAAFIDALLGAIQIDDYFSRTKDRSAAGHGKIVRNLLLGFFCSPDLSLRQIAQAIHRLGLVFASLRSDQWAFAISATVALIIRTIAPDRYNQFIRGAVSDRQVVDTVFGRDGIRTLQRDHEGLLFEATIILGGQEKEIAQSLSSEAIKSPLLQLYKDVVDAGQSDPTSRASDQDHANEVISMVHQMEKSFIFEGPHNIGFWHSVQRLELLSPALIDERSGVTSNDS